MSTETPPGPTSAPPSASQPVYMMYPPPQQEDGIGLIELVTVFWQRKLLIVGITFLFAAAGVAYALNATTIFRVEVVLASTERQQGSSGLSGIGILSGLTGITPGASGWLQAVAEFRSRAFIEEFLSEKDLLPVLFADQWDVANDRWMDDDPEGWPDIRDGVAFFTTQIRSIVEDPNTGLITLGIQWTDPELAAVWATELVESINERLRARDLRDSEFRLEYLYGQLEKANLVELRQAISRLIEDQIQTIMLAQSVTEYAFTVIDPARVPKLRIAPRRTFIVILATFLGGTIGVFGALLQFWLLSAARQRANE